MTESDPVSQGQEKSGRSGQRVFHYFFGYRETSSAFGNRFLTGVKRENLFLKFYSSDLRSGNRSEVDGRKSSASYV